MPFKASDGGWKLPLIIDANIHLLQGEPAETDYVSTAPDREDDFAHPLSNFVCKRASWPEIIPYLHAINSDFYNMCASLGKIDCFHYYLRDKGTDLGRFISTELEYLFTLLKSHFDLLQKVVARIWSHVELTDKSLEKRNLPERFRNMILTNDRIMSASEIAEKFHIPESLATFYSGLGQFYQMVKKTRDGIIHHGKEPGLVFVLPEGFAVSRDDELFRQFDIWREDGIVNKHLCSIRPLLYHLIDRTMDAFQEYTLVITRAIMFPHDMIPGRTVFTRGFHLKYLFRLHSTINANVWWPAIEWGER